TGLPGSAAVSSTKGFSWWQIADAALSPDGGILALAYTTSIPDPTTGVNRISDEVKLWDLTTGRLRLNLPEAQRCVWFSPDGRRLATAGESNTVKVWDARSGRLLLTLSGHVREVTCAAFSPDGRRVASGSMDRTVRLWDAATGREVFVLRGHTGDVKRLAFSGDGHRLVTGGEDGVRVWDATPPGADGP
ncbi:MAG TPA: hypothetical protein VFW33_18770, partial [Gemmataceae bacterium]|nr:hypothetical protein [Gemmataceae bacterium]